MLRITRSSPSASSASSMSWSPAAGRIQGAPEIQPRKRLPTQATTRRGSRSRSARSASDADLACRSASSMSSSIAANRPAVRSYGHAAERRSHEQAGVRPAGLFESAPQDEARAFEQVRGVRRRRRQDALAASEDGAKDVGLAAEVLMHERVRHPGALTDVSNGDGGVPALREELACRVEDDRRGRFPSASALALLAHPVPLVGPLPSRSAAASAPCWYLPSGKMCAS